MVCSTNNQVLLRSFKNKQTIMTMKNEYLTEARAQVYHAEDDTDLLLF